MKSVSRSRLEVIRLAHPNARLTQRDGVEVVIIPTYDIETDTAGEIMLAVHEDQHQGKPQPGEIRVGPTGNEFKVVDPPGTSPTIRKGPKADFGN